VHDSIAMIRAESNQTGAVRMIRVTYFLMTFRQVHSSILFPYLLLLNLPNRRNRTKRKTKGSAFGENSVGLKAASV
jgi:hypothetical protein